ncbi:MAG: HlyC/CorC family transporter [Fimbriimonadaceae bacterium]|nr:HlyC/CorC family transporter [Chitinophagales bacterium]
MLSELFIIFILICINGIFAMSEIALISVRRSRLETAAKKGDKRAKTALQLQENPTKLLSTVQFGITLTSILTGIFSGGHIKDVVAGWYASFGMVESYAESFALATVVVIITTFSLIIGELVPKRIGLTFPEGISKVMAAPMLFISTVAKPFIWFLTKSSDFIIRILSIKASDDESVTEEEIKAIIQEGTDTGAIEEIEQDIMERVFHLGDRKIGSLMTHRNEIIWLDVNEPTDKVRDDIESEIHSIYPVCDGDLDKTLGLVSIKDLFIANTRNNFHAIKDFVKPILFLPENNTAYSVLEKFKESKVHYALVIDEYGAVQGLVTINDILEALVGEFDELNIPEAGIIERQDGTFLVDAGIPFYDFLKYFEIEEFDDLEGQTFNTLAGMLIHELKHIPAEGEKIKWKSYEFEIMDMDSSRIDKVLFTAK